MVMKIFGLQRVKSSHVNLSNELFRIKKFCMHSITGVSSCCDNRLAILSMSSSFIYLLCLHNVLCSIFVTCGNFQLKSDMLNSTFS